MDWFLYDNGLCHVRVKENSMSNEDFVTYDFIKVLSIRKVLLLKITSSPVFNDILPWLRGLKIT